MLIRSHVYVSGRVQGIFFRANAAREARRLGLVGWVRNLPDERVEAVFKGEKEKVEEMISWCWRGPKSAEVEDLELEYASPTGEFSSFEVWGG